MNHNEKYACNYAVLQFLPYPESEEFVNLGVVVHCSISGLLYFRIESKKHRRVTGFFPELDIVSFKGGRVSVANELDRLETLCRRTRNPEFGKAIFSELVRRRETIFRFGKIRTILTADPEGVADQLFDRYVNRHFAQQREYQENVMARRYFDALQKHYPDERFRRDVIVGNASEYHVKIPICSDQRTLDTVPRKAIKPLDLDKTDPTAVIDHGDVWIQRVRRLKSINCMPEKFVFAVRYPKDDKCMDAAHKISQGLYDEGVVCVRDNEKELLDAVMYS